MFMFVVGVAQWLRRQVVALEIVGSNPTAHPFNYAPIAQRNRAPVFGTGGRGFESL